MHVAEILSAKQAREMTEQVYATTDFATNAVYAAIFGVASCGIDNISVSVPKHLLNEVTQNLEENGYSATIIFDGPEWGSVYIEW